MEDFKKKINFKKSTKDWVAILGIPTLLLSIWLISGIYVVNGFQELAEAELSSKGLHFKRENSAKWNLTDSLNQSAGHAYIGKAQGYGGDIMVLTIVDTNRFVSDIRIIAQTETPSYLQKLFNRNFFQRLISKKPLDLTKKNEIDVVSGASRSCWAVLNAVANGYSQGEGIPIQQKAAINIGLKEFLLLALFALAIIIMKLKNPIVKKQLYWISQVITIITLGIWLNSYLTLTQVNALLLGHFPFRAGELFIIILLAGSLLIPIFIGKNLYCSSVCPFGASQRLVGLMGNPKPFRPKYYKLLKYLQWSLALFAIALAIIYRNAPKSDFTIFDNLFRLNGPAIFIGILAIVMLLSLFVSRPWCHFLCPLDGVFEYLKRIHRTAKIFVNSIRKRVK